ncbi:hypothetical protein HZP84_15595 [Elizabethkingia anophelis]|uniref:Uncharacterized protein n=1 Tax=Elizabethkingia anophelis TaxID=1117645 RepID=A0A6I5UY84_9FLAO|nr:MULTISPECIES: hypothetical protein [Elizabethkingia]MCT3631860.1 hypothetical protein [Elizabethkingia anophelis]MCT3635374.1 hypothetical protein [Elizabethkingia anophelis]MCT3692384.1 hypothetical protein [Elizabethkingia anophelis]MCT3823689.1 hypothetical protein [Elizabethkingia anophelis]MCT3832115.1 hypothetical protein [Elizabethkingia anophelis]
MITSNEYYHFLSSLISKNNKYNWSTGLNGKSAVALFLFQYYQTYSDINAYNIGIDVLQNELDEFHKIKDLSFHKGISGVGWFINYLSSEKIIEVNADNFLPGFIEKQLKKVFFSNLILQTPNQLQICSDVLFYFSCRLFSTKRKRLKTIYHDTVNQILILQINFLYQIEASHLFAQLSFEPIFSNIKSLVYLYEEEYKSPLTELLLARYILLGKSFITSDLSSFELTILSKACNIMHKRDLERTIKNLLKMQNHSSDSDINNENIGLWDNGIAKKGLCMINKEHSINNLSLKYLLEIV